MNTSDKDVFSRFVIELKPKLQEAGMKLSVDVTAPDGGSNWSNCYDRNVIGDVADYIVFMAYDQYGISATEPGTTAGYNWVETSLKKFIDREEIASNKIILGIPFYTRLWEEVNGKATSKIVNMKSINSVIPNDVEKQWNEELKQYYIEYIKDGQVTTNGYDKLRSMLSTDTVIEVKDNKIIVDETKLRYGKFIITADAEVDGSHIRVLFLTFIWKFCPELLEKGYIYAAVPPLYKATMGTKIQYLKDDAALEAFRKSTSRNFELGRMKGLGEMDPDEMAETVMNTETRTLKQITMDDATLVAATFMSLMGESVGPRKKFIEDNAWRANIDV